MPRRNLSFILIFLLSTWLPFEGISQTKHWIYFTDKPTKELKLSISPKALLKRIEEGRILDEKDYEVSPAYLQTLSQQGVQISRTSRWLNAATAVLSPTQITELQQLPFVDKIVPVNRFSRPASITEGCDTITDLDSYTRQLSMIGLDKLHESGFTGKGVTIAVFDNGFNRVDQMEGFSHIFREGRMIATRDFVDGDDDVYEDCFSSGACRHGTHVLSTIAGVVENEFMGAAPDANFILLRTEDDASETSQEEDNWVAAAEYADSLGADIFSTSLGYLTYDGNIGSYSAGDLDGNTAAITLAGDIASEKGIIVVNSAGNRGANGLMAPSDGKMIISVGAVDKCRSYATFSSVGPTADGRLKPDISAMGQRVFTLSTDGSIGLRSGTSFSCPILSGFAACLLEASPQASRNQIYQAIIESGDEEPNYFTGHGVPNGPQALQWLRNFVEVSDGMVVFPNPSSTQVNVSFNNPESEKNYSLNILNINGQRVFRQNGLLSQGVNLIPVRHNLPEGIYFLQIIPTDAKNQLYTRTFIVTNT